VSLTTAFLLGYCIAALMMLDVAAVIALVTFLKRDNPNAAAIASTQQSIPPPREPSAPPQPGRHNESTLSRIQ